MFLEWHIEVLQYMKEEVGHFLWIKAATIVNLDQMLVCINEKNVMQKTTWCLEQQTFRSGTTFATFMYRVA